jgi:hypothetical protein
MKLNINVWQQLCLIALRRIGFCGFDACPRCWIGFDDWQRQIWHESGQYRTRTFLTYEEAEEVLRKYVRLDRIALP